MRKDQIKNAQNVKAKVIDMNIIAKPVETQAQFEKQYNKLLLSLWGQKTDQKQ